ncbi:MAG: 4-diphosphocytidyl-2C-methyl-D-erythritol synthase [Acidobacteria bacterium]|nr:MAG: 4-diphosphocytidyl-2C-methyl-D-erythritol synthase [Acidobacteriota bacterium]
MIAGIILAAGASRRMGSPKALLEYRGETFVGRLIRVLGGLCDPVIVVLGHDADAIRRQAGEGAGFVVNPDPERGQLSSLQTALAAVPAQAEGFLFTPVDCPAAERETVARLVDAFQRRDASTVLVIPRFAGRRGHPVCAASVLKPEFLALPPTSQARDVVRRHAGATQYVDVEDAGVLTDVDDPEAYRRLAGSLK